MIKENDKKRASAQKTSVQVLMEYARTIFLSFSAALIFTIFLSIHARNEMIKNLYISDSERQKIDEQIARKLVAQSDLTKDLTTKNFSVCMQVGNLYETAKDYINAEIAYSAALTKVKRGVYTPYYRLARVLIIQEKFEDAEKVIESAKDIKNKGLIKFKTKAYMDEGDKYYSLGKYLKAARCYEKSQYYYDRFSKKDKSIDDSIKKRIVKSYSEAATVIVQQGFNSDAVKFLHKAEKYAPNDYNIKYKLAIIYSELDPIKSLDYFEPLLKVMPQYIDYSTYNKALLKASNICELEGNHTKAKYYRYKSHSIDLLVNDKVIYKNDVNVQMDSFTVKKSLFTYHLIGRYRFKNESSADIWKLYADFVLKYNDEIKETTTIKCVTKDSPLFSNGGETQDIEVKFGKKIFTKKELEQYKIEIYLYKNEKYKTLVGTYAIPQKSIKNASTDVPIAFPD